MLKKATNGYTFALILQKETNIMLAVIVGLVVVNVIVASYNSHSKRVY